ncbi:BofC C-terminal domain-containing protein [Wukongibacter baidiensis]|uniref:BofC C-terminal domain-containing protein n=1 Tax=Wukongibacter baidiensis TaxID=1723361 RepID=UPI003D7FDE8E
MFYKKKRKRGRVVFLVCMLLIFAGFTYGYVSNNKPQVKPNPNDITKISDKDKINKEKDTGNKKGTESNTTDEVAQNGIENSNDIMDKVNKETNIMLKTYYSKTGEMDTKKIQIPITIVGASLNEFKSYIESNYSDWKIRSVSTKSASLFKQVEGYKPNSFVIQSNDGYVVIYRINEAGEKEVYEKTSISLSLLSETDKRKMEDGITVRSLDDVYNIIEDYSS